MESKSSQEEPMKKCVGIFGKLFGHKFKSLIIEREMKHAFENLHSRGSCVIDILEQMAHKKYKVICTRCGEKGDGLAETDKI
jgi:hypothetical protein